MASLTAVDSIVTVPRGIWSQLKPINREFVRKQVETSNWDLAVDIARLSFATFQNTSTNDLMIQQALREFNSIVIQMKEQILDAFKSESEEYAQNILDDLNRHLAILHQRLEGLSRETGAVGPALRESLASLNASASAVTALISSLKVPSVKGDLGEANIIDELRSSFLGVPNITVDPLGGSGETDAVVHFNSNGVEIAKALLENKCRSSWSNAFLAQLERDMIERGAHFGILVTTALPKTAKSRGYTLTERNGIIVITTPELAAAVILVLYDLLGSLERLSDKGRILQEVLRSRELVDCLTSNLSLIDPLRNIIKIVGKAHSDITSSINGIIDAIQHNNSKLVERVAPTHSNGEAQSCPQPGCRVALSTRTQRV
jgi:hypothetical protein